MSTLSRRSKRFVIGLTGGIATGKTTVLRQFARARIPVISSDELAHRCLKKGHPAARAILRRFETLDRATLGGIVFRSAALRKQLEKIIHPAVIKELKKFIQKHSGLIVLDIPLLFEARLESLVDQTLVVDASKKNQLERMRQRGLSRKEGLLRIAAQMPLSVKKKRADLVLSNRGSLAELRKRTRLLITGLKAPHRS